MISPAVWLRAGSFTALLIVLVGMAGCQDPPTPTVPVSGKVTVDKKPLTTGVVTYYPDAGKGNNSKESAVGAIGADGTYKLSTNGRDGAPVGWYKVTVSSQPVPTGDTPQVKDLPKGQPINSKYLRVETSGISVEVTDPPKPGAYDIDLK